VKIAFIGHGNVGGALADRLQHLGHAVTLAAADPGAESVTKRGRAMPPWPWRTRPRPWSRRGRLPRHALPGQRRGPAAAGGTAGGKVLVDCTNPVGPGLAHGLENREAGAQAVQKLVPGAKVVKPSASTATKPERKIPGSAATPPCSSAGRRRRENADRRADRAASAGPRRRRRPGAGAPPRAHDAPLDPDGADGRRPGADGLGAVTA